MKTEAVLSLFHLISTLAVLLILLIISLELYKVMFARD